MSQKILFKRGSSANLASVNLEAGEAAFTLDNGKLYIGNGTDKVLINPDAPILGTASGKDVGTAIGQVPVIGEDGLIDARLIPSINVANSYPAANKAAMLALDAEVGDIAIRADDGKAYMLIIAPANVESNWKKLTADIVTASSLGLGNVENTADADKSVATAAKLTTARTIALSGAVTGTATSFDGSKDIVINTTIVDASKLTGTIDCGTF